MVLEALEPERGSLRGERRSELGLPAFRGRGEGRSSQQSRGGGSQEHVRLEAGRRVATSRTVGVTEMCAAGGLR